MTSRPSLANHATYPAVHWFSFYALRDHLAALGFRCMDRFDLVDEESKGKFVRLAIRSMRRFSPLRFLGHIASPSTSLVGVRIGESCPVEATRGLDATELARIGTSADNQ
jgi:2-polyprenyl-6-hydroxyphenyl methylase/3-demethylubiquinone-9 3-methyltransferase